MVVVVGGSASSRPAQGKECITEQNLPPRYSDQLLIKVKRDEDRLLNNTKNNDDGDDNDEAIMRFEVTNLAQGASCSVTNALVLDSFLNLDATDVIIWEFLINGKCVIIQCTVCVPSCIP